MPAGAAAAGDADDGAIVGGLIERGQRHRLRRGNGRKAETKGQDRSNKFHGDCPLSFNAAGSVGHGYENNIAGRQFCTSNERIAESI